MRRILTLLCAVTLFIAVPAATAQAAPGTSGGHTTHRASATPKNKKTGTVSITLSPVAFHKTGVAAALQAPPSHCSPSISGTWSGWYDGDTGALETLEWDWSAKAQCTTTAAGQSLSSIQVSSDLWQDSAVVASGSDFTCSNCNLGNSVGDWICIGPTCAGGYWESGYMFLYDPPGYAWSSAGGDCSLVSGNPRLLECFPVTSVAPVPAVWFP